MSKTSKYYNEKSKLFFDNTAYLNMDELYSKVETNLGIFDNVLDVGAGSGRDSAYFVSQGYNVDAIDVSEELIKLAKDTFDVNIKNMSVLDLDESNKYSLIWCCASLLHLTSVELVDAFDVINRALVSDGICYMSFKLGDYEEVRNGRFFNDMNIIKFNFINNGKLKYKDFWITTDVRSDRVEKWINIIVTKNIK